MATAGSPSASSRAGAHRQRVCDAGSSKPYQTARQSCSWTAGLPPHAGLRRTEDLSSHAGRLAAGVASREGRPAAGVAAGTLPAASPATMRRTAARAAVPCPAPPAEPAASGWGAPAPPICGSRSGADRCAPGRAGRLCESDRCAPGRAGRLCETGVRALAAHRTPSAFRRYSPSDENSTTRSSAGPIRSLSWGNMRSGRYGGHRMEAAISCNFSCTARLRLTGTLRLRDPPPHRRAGRRRAPRARPALRLAGSHQRRPPSRRFLQA